MKPNQGDSSLCRALRVRAGEPCQAARRSAPAAGDSSFVERLLALNGLEAAGFSAWEFLPGMRFGERRAWWREGAARALAHEGLDLRCYRTAGGDRRELHPGAFVPPLWAGTVVAVTPDFLGSSVFVAHERLDREGRRLHTVYGHVEPRPGIAPGGLVRAGEEVGALAEPSGGRAAVPPHLHLTVALIARDGGPEPLGWEALRESSRVRLLDPEPLLWGTMPEFERA